MNTHQILQTKASASALTRRLANPSNRILLVDDDMNLCRLSADVLVHSGYHVHTAKDGAAGWEALLANSYDLLITEHRIRKISGVELVKTEFYSISISQNRRSPRRFFNHGSTRINTDDNRSSLIRVHPW